MNETTLHRTPALLLVLAILGALLAPLAQAAPGDAAFTVTLQKYEPTPVRPGEIVEAWIQVTNSGRGTSDPVTLTIEPTYPFTPASATDRVVNVGTLAVGSSYVARVRLAVDTATGDGTYILPVRVSTGSAASKTADLEIQVRSPNAVLDVLSAKTEPAQLVPGTPAEFAITVRNTQASVLRDVAVELDLDGTALSTLGTTTKQTVARIDGTTQNTFRFRLVADPEAQSGVVRVPMTLTFTTTDGSEIVQTETTGVLVHAEPAISVLVDRVTASADGKEATVLVRVVNKGLSQIKFAEITAQDSDAYDLGAGRRTAYVGNIDSDDFQTAEFALIPSDEGASGSSATLRGTLTYSDALNTPVTMTFEAPFSFPAKQNGGSGSLVVVIGAIVIVVGVILWRRRSRGAEKRR